MDKKRIGYSYLRYSSDQQGDGDSIRRQTAMAKAWCDRNQVHLDVSTTFTDRGKSAFRGKHRLTGALGIFLADVEAGRIPKGSYLIIENLDRLSREDEYEATKLLTSLVIAGISIVTLSPRETVYEKGNNNLAGLVLAVVEFARANSESKSKEMRSDENWMEKKRLARESGKVMTAAPAVIDEGTWARAQGAIASHKKPRRERGGIGKNVASVFTGILVDARTQSRMLVTWAVSGGAWKKYRVLKPSDTLAQRSPAISFPYYIFEAAILSKLKEISPREILGQESAPESEALAAELAVKEQKIRELEGAEIEDVPALVRIVTKLTGEAQELKRRVAIAKQKEAKPQSEAWDDAQSLLDLATDEDHRTRLRSALRRIVESIYILVVPRNKHRLAAVQIFFAGGARRDFLIHYWSAGHQRQRGCKASSFDLAAGALGPGPPYRRQAPGQTR